MGLEEDSTKAQADSPDVPLRPSEKKRLNWKGLTCTSISARRRWITADRPM